MFGIGATDLSNAQLQAQNIAQENHKAATARYNAEKEHQMTLRDMAKENDDAVAKDANSISTAHQQDGTRHAEKMKDGLSESSSF